MGGIFGKSKRPCVFPRVVYKAKGKRTAGTPQMFCDASTWTGESHFYSARIGRTPKGPEPPKVVLETCEGESEQEPAGPAAPPRAQHSEASLPVTAGDARGVEGSQEPEAKPPTEVMQHQELPEQAKQAQAGQSLQESSGSGDAPCPAGSCEDHDVPPLPQTTVQVDVHVSSEVQVDVHVSAEVQGGPEEAQCAPAGSQLLPGAGQEAGAGGAAEEAAAGKAPVQEAGDSPAAGEDSGLPLEAAETREGITNGHRAAEDAEGPADLQLGQDTEVPITEGMEANASEAEQAGEKAELCEDGQAAEEIPCCLAGAQDALQEREKIKVSSGGKPEEY
ncbi:neurofilament heavy polypeptide-like [Chiroxiphia lanceolata]|uniref:neurofilament heavy polypeptide-like n=1 Tax=Chiroxiphia lanceolata TaxID=296741 RepID=UPI0013CEB978|nr:neurofilament heavy polypeptide-like [Chiroxiphia lanceolata]